MTDDNNMQDGGVPEEFVERVKQALEHLYDFSYLQRHPLWEAAVPSPDSPSQAPAAQHYRQELLAAIEALGPGPGVAFRASHARLYNLLHLRYVEGLSVQETANELGLSPRQAYRDLRRGEESVAAMLWSRYASSLPQEAGARRLSSLEAEMERLEFRPHAIDVCPILRHVQDAVRLLALQRGVTVEVEAVDEPVIIYTDPAVAQQVLISALSRAIQQASPGPLHLGLLTSTPDEPAIVLRYTPSAGSASGPAIHEVAARLCHRLGWAVEQVDQEDEQRVVAIHVTAHGPTVLVIDDNEGLVDLLGRYLSAHAYRVIAATSGEQGLQLAHELAPEAIVLDVMMPEVDGWEVLQTLQNHPGTCRIPVIVCSVFNDPELAYSLGASLFVPKPVRRDAILAALQELGIT